MPNKRRKSAQDIFRDSSHTFFRKGIFEQVFPTVEDVRVEVEETGHGIRQYQRKRAYNREFFEEFINCQNSGCYGGGFSVGEVLREAVDLNLRTHEKSGPCVGFYSGPSGKRKGLPCDHMFRVKISVKYNKTP